MSTTDALPEPAANVLRQMRDSTNQTWLAKRMRWADEIEAALAAQAEKHAAELAGLEAVRAEQAAGREYWCNEAQRLQAENFALAAGQCANVTGDEGGTPQCKEIDALRAERDALKVDAERMIDWIEGDCSCPCCEGVSECSEGCTFAVDAPTDAERMAEARAVLYGDRRTGGKA